MTTKKVVTDDRVKPTAEEIATYTARMTELNVRFLKGSLQTQAVLDGIQELMGLRHGFVNCNGQPDIPLWTDHKHPIIQHVPCGVFDPRRLAIADVLVSTEHKISGEQFLDRTQGGNAMNACGFDYYVKPENWKYIPGGVRRIVFPQTIFRRQDGYRCVRVLERAGVNWEGSYASTVEWFNHLDQVAIVSVEVMKS